ncbi:hypothetical protein D3C86_1352170 [compost metagenome]
MYINCDVFSQFFSAMLPLEVSEFGVLLEASLPNSIESIYIQYRWLIALVFQGNCLDRDFPSNSRTFVVETLGATTRESICAPI